MDNIDTLVKGSDRTSAANETAEAKTNGQGQGASLNAQATSSYLVLLSKQRGLLSEGLSRTLNSLAGTLNEYIKNPASLQNQNVDLSSSELAQYRRLSEQVIARDANLQEKVAQNLSTSHRLVRSRDAGQELSRSMQNLPESLREGTQAGKALSRFICESLVDLTDPKAMGAGLERDLAVRSVFVPKTPLNSRSQQATSSVLSSSIAYIESNQPEVLRNLKPEETQIKERQQTDASAATTPQAMTRYLRQALNEFPDDSTYLDIFKQNRDHKQAEPYQDKLSKETAERIHSLISRAADTAKRGNLMQRNPAQGAAQDRSPGSPTATAVNHNPTEQITQRASQLKSASTADVREMSLSELSARAAKLQQQFREERQRLAGEGKLPNPAEYPKTQERAAVKAETPVQSQVKSAEVSAEPKAAAATAKPAQAETQPVRSAPAETAAKAPSVQADTEAINKLAPKVSYQGIQSTAFNFGSLGDVPGQTMAYGAKSVADSAQVQDLSALKTQASVQAQHESAAQSAQETAAKAEPKDTAPVRQEPVLTSDEINALKQLAKHAQDLQKADLQRDQAASEAAKAAKAALAAAEEAKAVAQKVASESAAATEAAAAAAAQASAAAEAATAMEASKAQAEEPVAEDAAVIIPEEQVASETAKSAEVQAPVAEAEPEPQPAPEAAVAVNVTADAASGPARADAQPREVTQEKAPQVITPEEQAYAESAAQAARRQEAVADLTEEMPETVPEELPPEEQAPVASEEEAQEFAAEQAVSETSKLSVPPMPSQSEPQPVLPQTQSTVTPMPNLSQSSESSAASGETNALAKLYSGVSSSQDGTPAQSTAQQTVQSQTAAAEVSPQTADAKTMMLSTVPADELDDSEVPQDAKLQGADGKAGKLATQTIDTTAEQATALQTQPLNAPGAAAVTTGGSAPIPEQSVVEEQQVVKENTLFSKIVSLFGNKAKSENLHAQAAQATMAAAGSGNSLSALKGSPLDTLLFTLRSQAESQEVPAALRAEAQQFMKQLQQPVADLVSVNNWLNFVTGPISPSSPQALALHQWAFMLLCIRFNHIGKSIDKYLAKVKGEPLKESFGKMADAMADKGGSILDMLDETLDEVSRLQQLASDHEVDQVFPRYIPLPPTYSSGREGSLAVRSQQDEDGRKSWHLTFNFDLPGLGPIEIKAVAKLPELRLSVVTETLSGLQRVQECLPLLAKQLQQAGITTRSANARLGRIMLQHDAQPEEPSAPRADGASLSVEI
ncbi:MAG: flagellar hook-length control protein FliK [Succinivibrio sp.]|nr:flagellar hook-length control protein FliK [Succinivibrio sp.]